MTALQRQTETSLDRADRLMMHILPKMTVCGEEKDCYKTSCYEGGVRVTPRESAIDYSFVYYGTTFKRFDIKESEKINVFIIDVDYKFLSDIDDVHSFVTNHIMAPTFTIATNKGYQFIFGLQDTIHLSDKGTALARMFNERIMQAFSDNEIDIDKKASTRLIGTYRNPLVHTYRFHDKLWKLQEIDNALPKPQKTVRINAGAKSKGKKAEVVVSGIRTGTTDDKKLKIQQETVKRGFVYGNRNDYFYLVANKEMVLKDPNSLEQAIHLCRLVHSSVMGAGVDPIPDNEVIATANKLWAYRKNSELFMPRVFSVGKRKENSGKYRLELNATVGYTTLEKRRSETAKLVNRDRKNTTAAKIKEGVLSLDQKTFELSKTKFINAVAKASGVSARTLFKYHDENPYLFSRPPQEKETNKTNVLDCTSVNPCKAPPQGLQERFELKIKDLGYSNVRSVEIDDEEIVINFDTG